MPCSGAPSPLGWLIVSCRCERSPPPYSDTHLRCTPSINPTTVKGSRCSIRSSTCSTGEEAYSMAMLLLEELEAANKDGPVQIFASDIDSEALKLARHGIYPDSIAADVSQPRLNQFFTKRDSIYQVSKQLRQSVIF